MEGLVVSSKMNKTCVVETENLSRHPLYEKVLKKHKKFYVHDEENRANTGDKVIIEEMRPKSKLKRWRLCKIKEKQ